jgi:hypothetical protein
MIGYLTALNTFQFSLKMKESGPKIVTIAILLKPSIAVCTALQITSSVETASCHHTPIHHFISLKDGMENFSNPQLSLTLDLSSILDTEAFLAHQIHNMIRLTSSFVLWILWASHITALNHVAVNMQNDFISNFCNTSFSHQPLIDLRQSSHFLFWIDSTLNLLRAKYLQAISTVNCGDLQTFASLTSFQSVSACFIAVLQRKLTNCCRTNTGN